MRCLSYVWWQKIPLSLLGGSKIKVCFNLKIEYLVTASMLRCTVLTFWSGFWEILFLDNFHLTYCVKATFGEKSNKALTFKHFLARIIEFIWKRGSESIKKVIEAGATQNNRVNPRKHRKIRPTAPLLVLSHLFGALKSFQLVQILRSNSKQSILLEYTIKLQDLL